MRTSGSWGSTPASRKNEDEAQQVGACSSLGPMAEAQVLAVTWPTPDVHHRSSPARSCLSRDQRAPRRSFMLTWSPMRLTARPTPCPRRAASSTIRVRSRPHGGPRFELAGRPVGSTRPPAPGSLGTRTNGLVGEVVPALGRQHAARDGQRGLHANAAAENRLAHSRLCRTAGSSGQCTSFSAFSTSMPTVCWMQSVSPPSNSPAWATRSHLRAQRRESGPLVDAAIRFIVQGGSGEPDRPQLRRIELAVLGQLTCPQGRMVR
jgi:hypothetical protein